MGIEDNAILRPGQKKLLGAFVRSPLARSYYLSGGTALAAFHLGHRQSDDLDFFTDLEVPLEPVLEFLGGLGMGAPDYQHLFDRRIFILGAAPGTSLKVEFTRYPFPRCESGCRVEGLDVDSLRDILANKLLAITERHEPKDFVDLYCGLLASGGPPIDSLVDDAEGKFGVRGVRHMLGGGFLGGAPDIAGLELTAGLDAAVLSRFFVETARRWVRESLDADA